MGMDHLEEDKSEWKALHLFLSSSFSRLLINGFYLEQFFQSSMMH